MTRDITDKDRAVLIYLKTNIQAGKHPSQVEICQNFGWASRNSAKQHLNRLAEQELITISTTQHRGIDLTEKGHKEAVILT